MKNSRKDEVSDSSDNPNENSKSSEENGGHLDAPKRPHSSLASDSDSDSEPTSSVNADSKNKFNSEELTKTTHVEAVRQKKSVSVRSTFNFEDLTSDDEIYTLQCPSVYNKQDLLNKSIDFTKPNQGVMTETEKFQFEMIDSGKKYITLAVPKRCSSGTLINLPLKGHIVIQKVIKTEIDNPVIKDVCSKAKVVFPEDIKVRHPLLGVNWQDHIKTASEAIEKSSYKKHKSVKKEKAMEIKGELKKRKRKIYEDEPSVHKKRKKHE